MSYPCNYKCGKYHKHKCRCEPSSSCDPFCCQSGPRGPQGPQGPYGPQGSNASSCTLVNDTATVFATVCDPVISNGLVVKTNAVSDQYISAQAVSIPDLGAGTRMTFDKTKAAFRVGTVTGTEWNTASVGQASFAANLNTIASGANSNAFGFSTTASGFGSHAEGGGTTASGQYAHAEGNTTTAPGFNSHAEGNTTTSSGTSSHAEGSGSTASGFGSHAEGGGTTASGQYAHSEGNTTLASGFNSHAEGITTTSSGTTSHAEGVGSTASGVGAHAEGNVSVASGQYSHAENISTASNDFAHSEGTGTTASGYSSHAEGGGGTSSGSYAHTEGTATTASGFSAHAEGSSTTASGQYAHSEGNSTIGDIEGVHIMGRYGHARADNQAGAGGAAVQYEYSWQLAGGLPTTDLTISGNGISAIIHTTVFGDQPTSEMIANAFTVGNADYAEYFEWQDGNPKNETRVGYFVGLVNDKIILANSNDDVIGITSLTACITADAAELGWNGAVQHDEFGSITTQALYFATNVLTKYGIQYPSKQYLDKNAMIRDVTNNIKYELFNKIQYAITNANDMNNFITIAQIPQLTDILTTDEIKTPNATSIVNKLINVIKTELNHVNPIDCAVLSPSYNPSQTYIPRSQRPEWIPVGLLGKIYVRDNGACVVGSKCNCLNGIAVPGTKWRVLSRTHPNVIRILYASN